MSQDPSPSPRRPSPSPAAAQVVEHTRTWLERAVIGLNFCPFARAEFVNNRIRYQVSLATSSEELLSDLARELEGLQAADPATCETTLLIHPHVLADFVDYNQFLGEADALLRRLGLEGVLQVASFHPRYQFAGTDPDDVTNFTNRSPYPTLHLLREASVERAAGPEESARIVERNVATLRRMGREGWRRLGIPGEGSDARL
jgi:uncharacterized protein